MSKKAKNIDAENIHSAIEAFKIQEKIGKLIDKLDKLGFEFMFYNQQSSIRRKR